LVMQKNYFSSGFTNLFIIILRKSDFCFSFNRYAFAKWTYKISGVNISKGNFKKNCAAKIKKPDLYKGIQFKAFFRLFSIKKAFF
jgi:hypothetical protein